MNFLSPWFLAATALIAGPIIAHLIRRVTRDRVFFSATHFLEASPPRLQRQRRFQHPWLLVLRSVIVGLLALAFARPFFRGKSTPVIAADVTQDVVLVLDESASMRRAGLWNEARDRAVRIAEGLRSGDRCSVLLASSVVTPLLTTEQWTQTPPAERGSHVRSLLASRTPGWGPLFLDTAIDSALEVFADTPHGTTSRQRVVVISDFAAGTRTTGLAGRDWPPGCEVVMERTFPRIENNAGLQFIGWDETTGGVPQARLRVTRDQGAPALPLKLQLRDGIRGVDMGEPLVIDLGPGQTRVVTIPLPKTAADGFEALLTGDAADFDNRVWFVPPKPRVSTVAYVGQADPGNPQHAAFYVTRALSSAPGLTLSIAPVDPRGSGEGLDAAAMIVVTEPPGPPVLEALRKRLEAGAFVVITASDSDQVNTAATLAGETGWSVSTGSAPALLGQIDFAHPLFALFGNPRYSDFTHLRFWRPQPIRLPAGSAAQVVARFEDGAAAVLESSVGRGRVITWGGDWSPAASQWVLSTKFVPWLQSLLERASGGPPRPSYSNVGDASRLSPDPAAEWKAASDPAAAFSRSAPTAPGLYQLKDDDGLRWTALEVPAEESRTDPLPLDAFEQLGVPTRVRATTPSTGPAAIPVDTAAIEIEGRQKLWRWALVVVAGLLALESVIAWALSRRSVVEPVVTGG